MDRTYAHPLAIPSLAGIAHLAETHFIRTFRATFGEMPHRSVQGLGTAGLITYMSRPRVRR